MPAMLDERRGAIHLVQCIPSVDNSVLFHGKAGIEAPVPVTTHAGRHCVGLI